uniref:Uncharacterized protein n=1 Tax=Alexandrium catenella TaxID=2925 RepID=A0A7S1RSC9_ALECA
MEVHWREVLLYAQHQAEHRVGEEACRRHGAGGSREAKLRDVDWTGKRRGVVSEERHHPRAGRRRVRRRGHEALQHPADRSQRVLAPHPGLPQEPGAAVGQI